MLPTGTNCNFLSWLSDILSICQNNQIHIGCLLCTKYIIGMISMFSDSSKFHVRKGKTNANETFIRATKSVTKSRERIEFVISGISMLFWLLHRISNVSEAMKNRKCFSHFKLKITFLNHCGDRCCMLLCKCEGQRSVCGSWFSPAPWVSGIESGMCLPTVTHPASPHVFQFEHKMK